MRSGAGTVMYETKANLEAEAKFVDHIAAAWGCEVRKVPKRYSVDYFCYRGERLTAVLEVKCRSFGRGKYEATMVDTKKVMNGMTLASMLGVPFIFAVRWNDFDGWVNLTNWQLAPVIAGRTDRGDPDDIQPHEMIPVELFRPVSGGS